MGLRRFWWDSLSLMYLYASVLFLLMIPLWFTAAWSEYSEDYGGEMVIGLHATLAGDDKVWYSVIAILLFLASAVLLALPLFRRTVHIRRRLIVTRLIALIALLYLLLITLALADTIASEETLSDFAVNTGVILLILDALVLIVLQTVISIRSKRYGLPKTGRPKTLTGRNA